jgi:Asp-tRNA(Asn)/Glu-tRNA(Gln) amidotransferase A subunit family amidase
VQLIAPFGRDDLLITVAAALEAAEPWSQRRATVSA